jgi:hypothetical protein
MPFPTNVFVSGHANPVVFQVLNQSAMPLNITGWSGDESVTTLICTHSGSGGVAARIPNVLDGKWTVTADLDLLVPAYLNPPFIAAGVSGNIFLYVAPPQGNLVPGGIGVPAGPPRAFNVPCIIQKVHWESQVAGKVSYAFDVEMNSLTGVYLRPQQ